MGRIRSSGLHALSSVVIASAMAAMTGHAAAAGSDTSVYIVQMSDAPVLAAPETKPAEGQKVDPDSAAVVSYVAKLQASQDALLSKVGAANKIYSYTYTVNGFAAQLTADQAASLAKAPNVLAVTKDELRAVDTSTTPTFLGLAGAGGFWQSTGAKGDGVIIGMVDSGITPESPSFAGANFGAPPTKWSGTCQTGEQWTTANCNNKLIGARYYNGGFGGNAAITAAFPGEEFNSPRDFAGHGTHTASTAGGNEGVTPTGPLSFLGAISGMAPRARIAAYKVCWGPAHLIGATGRPASGCFNSDSVAAIDQAVKDGVDVINFSISGTQTNFMDPVEQAFYRAAAAGVFVAASAGNSGPTTGTVAHPSPWLTTVAAGTHPRELKATLTLGNGATYVGASTNLTAVTNKTMILSTNAAVTGANATSANLCFSTTWNGGTAVLDPVKVSGKIVVCDRGTNDRVDKSKAVFEAGGVGMVLINPTSNTIVPDLHSVPTVHLQNTDRTAVRAYAGGALPTGSISVAVATNTAPAPLIASFSSRGPSPAASGDLLKPDIIAPGQDILAAVAPTTDNLAAGVPQNFALYSGTSMSSPHIAGIGALFKQVYPKWSPMAIKSALMTSAGDVLDGPNTFATVVIAQGAGHVRPTAALNPGLVFDSGPDDWRNFLCGQGYNVVPVCSTFAIDASDLNVASIAIGDMAGSQTVKRKVTNVSGATATYTASYTGLTGYNVTVSPSTLTLAPGQTAQFTVTFTRTTANVGFFLAGQLTWTSGATNVRIPMLIASTANSATAPTQLNGTGGPFIYKVNIGYTGSFSATPRGLIPAVSTPGTASTGSNTNISVTIPAGTTYARFSLFDADVKPGSDIDLVVLSPANAVVGSSGGSTSSEEVNLVNPAPGVYTVQVQGFAVSGTSPFKLQTWLLGTASTGNMTVYPTAATPVTAGQQVQVSVVPISYLLTQGVRYLGSVAYTGGATMPAPTIIRVDR